MVETKKVCEPLKGKRRKIFAEGTEPSSSEHIEYYFKYKDVVSAVEWLKKKLKDRVDELYKEFFKLPDTKNIKNEFDALLHEHHRVLNLINEAFEDLTKKEVD